MVLKPGVVAGSVDGIPILLEPALNVRQEIPLALGNGERGFAAVQATEVFLNSKVLAEAGRERSDTGSAKPSNELAVSVGAADRLIEEVFSLFDQVLFCEASHGYLPSFILILYHT